MPPLRPLRSGSSDLRLTFAVPHGSRKPGQGAVRCAGATAEITVMSLGDLSKHAAS
jgi:hypothetical protein